jgi:hypothetical protein
VPDAATDPLAALEAAFAEAMLAQRRVARCLTTAEGRIRDDLSTLADQLPKITYRAARRYAEALIERGAAPC